MTCCVCTGGTPLFNCAVGACCFYMCCYHLDLGCAGVGCTCATHHHRVHCACGCTSVLCCQMSGGVCVWVTATRLLRCSWQVWCWWCVCVMVLVGTEACGSTLVLAAAERTCCVSWGSGSSCVPCQACWGAGPPNVQVH
jgi:hypothetical protein